MRTQLHDPTAIADAVLTRLSADGMRRAERAFVLHIKRFDLLPYHSDSAIRAYAQQQVSFLLHNGVDI